MKESHTKDKGDMGLDREGLARGGMNEVVLPEHLFHICTISTIPGPARSYRFLTF